ncbi:uncharacterized protein [Oscarella lobularis]|uniref:uncharacterized protein n=1 Tax=Oscarella lobularis TaxID=121494 RepID=UPI003313564B
MILLLLSLVSSAATIVFESNPDCNGPTVDIQTGVKRLRCDRSNAFDGGDLGTLFIEPTESLLIVGGRNRLYSFDYDFNLRERVTFEPDDRFEGYCRQSGIMQENCQNFVRVVGSREGRLFTCGTNAKKPMCHYRKLSNISHVEEIIDDASRICPDVPGSAVTVQLPPNSSAVFSGFVGSLRHKLTRDMGNMVSLNIDSNSRFMSAPEFVSSFTIGNYVYFFYRDLVVSGDGKRAHTSRIGRVCQNDPGGQHIYPSEWVTFVRTSFKCRQPGNYEILLYDYEYLTSVSVVERDGRRWIFATFQPPANGPAAGVVCVFGFDGYMQRDAMDIFERNYVSSQDRSDFTKFDNLCGRNEYEAAPYIETAESVEQMTDTPILIKSGIRFRAIAANSFDRHRHLFFIATESGTVEKHFLTLSDDGSEFTLTQLYSLQAIPLNALPQNPILDMKMNVEQNVLFLGSEALLVRVPITTCDAYSHDCNQCLVSHHDPQCGWCPGTESGRCTMQRSCPSSLWTQNSTICTRFLSSEKPRLLKQSPKTVSLSLNDAFFVDCLSSGQPTPTYWWFRNGHILPGHTTANLTVTILGASDGGLYSCTAHNSLGNASMEVEITVKPFVIVQPPVVAFGSLGHSVVLPCSASGYPSPAIHWHKDGKRLTTNPQRGIYVSNTGSLVLSRGAEKRDEGVYECSAVNDVGIATVYGSLYSDTRGNASVEMIAARLGHFVVLQCPLHADNSSSISWTKDGRQLESTSDNLTLTAVRSIDAGLYQCARFTSRGSSLTALINVIILVPPTLTPASPLSISVGIGQTTQLKVNVDGEPKPQVTWFKRGQRIDPVDTSARSLYLSDLRKEDSGEYTCVAASPLGLEQVSFSLNVQELDVQCPPSSYLPKGSGVLFTCNVSTGIANVVAITWRKNGGQLSNDLISEQLNISQIGFEDEGEYSCVTKFANGRTTTCHWQLEIDYIDPNVVGESKSDEKGVALSVAQLVCSLAGAVLLGIIATIGGIKLFQIRKLKKSSVGDSQQEQAVAYDKKNDNGGISLRPAKRSRIEVPSTSSLAPLTEVPESSSSPTDSSTASEMMTFSPEKSVPSFNPYKE